MSGAVFNRLREDFAAHGRDPWRQGVWVMVVYRFGQWRYRVRPALLRKPLSLLYKVMKVGVQIAAGIDLPCEARVGRRLVIEHFGGIVISGDAVIGDDVDIGAGAKILGPVHIGDGAVIGANAVVLCDVPAGTLAVGIPARIKVRRPAADRRP